jgi:hypothetical protein
VDGTVLQRSGDAPLLRKRLAVTACVVSRNYCLSAP